MSALGGIAKPSLVRTLTIRLVGAAILMMTLQAGLIAVRDYLNETDFHDNYIRREALRLARLVPVQAPSGDARPAAAPSQYTGRNARAYAYRIVDATGRLIAGANADLLVPLSPWTDRPGLRQDSWVQKIDPVERMHVAGGLKVRREHGDVWVELATFGDPDATYLSHIAQDVLDDVWVPMLPLVLLTIIIAATSVRSSLRPLVRAASRADEIAVLERGERLDVAALPAEASHFASAINRLLDRVADLVAAHRLFIARAAHELRTPLSIMMLELSHLQRDDARRIEGDIRQMSEIVDQLLALSRLQAIARPPMAEVDITAMVGDLVARMQGLASGTRHTLTFASHHEKPILGDETTLREAVRNLVDNAIKHTPAGTGIHVDVRSDGSIVVEDDGPGIGALSAEEIQQPFRKGSVNTSGAGLGLAIVRQAAELHGGSLRIGRSELGGASFQICLPQPGSVPAAAG